MFTRIKERFHAMFIAYIRNDIEPDSKVDGLEFSMRRQEDANRIALFSQVETNKDRYVLKGTTIQYHKSWLTCLTLVETNNSIGLLQTSCGELRIVSFNRETRKYFDIECERFIVERAESYYSYRHFDDMNQSVFSHHTKWVECKHCGERVSSSCVDKGKVCKTCIDKFYKQCKQCGKNFLFDKTKHIFESRGYSYVMCDDCLTMIPECSVCGKKELRELMSFVEGKHYCRTCFKPEQFVRCVKCGLYFLESSKNISKIRDHHVCSICNFSDRIQMMGGSVRGGIHDYNYKPEPEFFGHNDSDPLFFGVEVELVTPQKRITKLDDHIARWIQFEINEKEPFVYCKFDRSIGNEGQDGFEVVTHPFNWTWLKSEEGSNKIKQIMELNSFNCSSFTTNTCGMHVHMSKDAFTYTQLYKFLKLVFENKDFNILMSERTDMGKVDEFASFVPDYPLNDLAKAKSNGNDREQRHKAVNLACPNTVEMRIFKGTLEFNRFMKNIEYCKALYDYSGSCTMRNATIPKFKEFVADEKKTFRNLYEFLTLKGEIKK